MFAYPTPLHAAAAESAVQFFSARPETGAVLLVNSCARGKGTPESDLDMVVLVDPGVDTSDLDAAWQVFRAQDPAISDYLASGWQAVLHLDIEPAVFDLPDHEEDEYPDAFDIVIGNWLVWSAVRWEQPGFHDRLRRDWLPFYEEGIRTRRLAEVRFQCELHLRMIPAYVGRELYFQAFSRLWRSFQLFLQALFIHHRQYPIAYDKWIREQVVDILKLPELYPHLPPLFEITHLESDALVGKARDLEHLLATYIPAIEPTGTAIGASPARAGSPAPGDTNRS